MNVTKKTLKNAFGKESNNITPEQERKRIVELSKIISKYPECIVRKLARRKEASWLFGRLYLLGAISQNQFKVAERLDLIIRNYRRIFGRFVNQPGAIDYSAVGGDTIEDLTDSALKKASRAQREYDRAMRAISRAGDDAKQAIIIGYDKDKLVVSPDLIAEALEYVAIEGL